MKVQNLVGPQVRKLRFNQGWSQAQLAVQLQLKGLDIGREGVVQIEGQTHCVKDKDLPYLATAFGVQLVELFPPFPADKPVYDTMMRLLRNGETEPPPKVVTKSIQPCPAILVHRS
jgi:transcriptional regulator with XRE-family HTH domain